MGWELQHVEKLSTKKRSRGNPAFFEMETDTLVILILIVGGFLGMMYSYYLMNASNLIEEKEVGIMDEKSLIKKIKTRVAEDSLDGKIVSTIVLGPKEQITPEIKKQFGDLGMKVQVWKANQGCSKFKKGDIFITVTIPEKLSSVISMQMADEI